MPMSFKAALGFCIILVATVFLSAPAMALDTLTASPPSLTFNWVNAQLTNFPGPQQVTITGVGGATITPSSVTFSGTDTNNVTDTGALFLSSVGGNVINVGLNQSAVNFYLTRGLLSGEYDATMTVKATGYSDLTVSLALVVGTQVTLSANVTSITLVPQSGNLYGTSTFVLTGQNLGYSIVLNSGYGTSWLQISPQSGVAVPGGTTVSLQGYLSSLPTGTTVGNLVITSGSQTLTIPIYISYSSGGYGNLSASQNPITMSYSTGGTIPSMSLILYDYYTSGATYSATAQVYSGGVQWLLINGTTSQSGTFIGGSASLTVSANPTGLTTGTYLAYINVYSYPDNGTLQIPVSLSINGATSALSVSPSPVNLSSAATSATVTLSTTSPGGTWTATSSQSWLAANPTNGTLGSSQQVTIFVYPTAVAAGSYTGTITFTGAGTSTSLVVYFNNGGGGYYGNLAANPTALTFAAQAGAQAQSQQQQVAVSGYAGGTYSTSLVVNSPSGGNWVFVSPSGGSTPDVLTVSVNSGNLAAGTYTATLTITSTNFGSQTVSITLNVYSTTGIISNTSYAANYTPGGAAPQSQTIYVMSTSPGTEFPVTFAASQPWIILSGQTNTNTPSGVAISIDTTKLSTGANNGFLTVTAPGAANSPLNIPVTVVNGTGSSGTGALNLSPASISWQAATGSTTSQSSTLTINTSASAYYTVSVASSGSWLNVSSTAGYAPTSITVTGNPTGLTAGTYTGTITVNANGSAASVTVTLVVGSGGGTIGSNLTVDSTPLSFTTQAGGAAPANQTFQVTSTGSQLTITTSASDSWLTVTPGTTTTPGTVTVAINPGSLTAGSYTGTVTIASSGASNSPVTKTVNLTVTAPPDLTLDQSTLTFTARTDGTTPAAQNVKIGSTGSVLTYTATPSAGWISVSPGSGTTESTIAVSVTPGSLTPGSYSGTVTVAGTAGATKTITVNLTLAGPLPTVTSVLNWGSRQEGAVSPGMIVVIEGNSIGPLDLATYSVQNNKIGTVLSDTRVLFNGIPSPVMYASSTQVEAIVPYILAGRADTFVQVEYQGVRSNAYSLRMTTANPGVLTQNASGTGPAAVLNADYSQNAPGNGAARNDIVRIYFTGEGQTVPSGVDGQFNPDTADPSLLPKPVLPVTVLIDGKQATVRYYGAVPGQMAGLAQADAVIPPTAGTGPVPVVLMVGNNSSQQDVTIVVK